MKTSYVLSGSGTKLFTFIGALRVLFTAGFTPRRLIGTSGGGLVALFIAARYDEQNPLACVAAAEKFARSLELHKLLDGGGLRWPRFWHGLYKGDLILERLRDALPRSWGGMKLPEYVVTSDRTADAAKVWGVEDKIEPALAGRATMSLPIFDAVKIKGHWHTDGGTRANYPLAFFKDDPTVIGLRFRPIGKAGMLGPGEEAAAVQSFKNKIEFQFDNVDDMIEATSRMHMEAAVKARTIMLDAPGSGMDFNVSQAEIDDLIKAGEDSARKWLAARR